MNERQQRVADLCDGIKTSKQIAKVLGERHKYVQEVALKFDLPRRRRGSATGSLNGSYKHGRRFDRDGYVLVSCCNSHPSARVLKDRKTGIIAEHRLLMEKKLGRHLVDGETVDHIDGLRMHNAPENLRLFSSNGEHLKKTISGQVPKWSKEGVARMKLPHSQRKGLERLDTYNQMKKSGDARLIQILLGMLKLGKDSPYLLGSSHHLEKAQIFDLSHTNLKRALDDLYRKYE